MNDRPTDSEFADLPSADEVLAETRVVTDSDAERRVTSEEDYGAAWWAEAVKSERAWVHLRGLTAHYRHKSNWSLFLMFVLATMIAFQWLLLGMVGAGRWDFTRYEWLLPILLVQNLGQIIGLAFVVVKSLFKDIDGG